MVKPTVVMTVPVRRQSVLNILWRARAHAGRSEAQTPPWRSFACAAFCPRVGVSKNGTGCARERARLAFSVPPGGTLFNSLEFGRNKGASSLARGMTAGKKSSVFLCFALRKIVTGNTEPTLGACKVSRARNKSAMNA